MKKVYIHFQVDSKLKEQLEFESKQKGLSLNSYIRMLLIEREK